MRHDMISYYPQYHPVKYYLQYHPVKNLDGRIKMTLASIVLSDYSPKLSKNI